MKKEIFRRFRVDIELSTRILANQRSEFTNIILYNCLAKVVQNMVWKLR
jgi:hypothetical protein